MDITFTILANIAPQTAKASEHDVGDIVEVQRHTGLGYTHPNFRLLHVTDCPVTDFETFKQYYIQPVRVVVDGKIEEARRRKMTVKISNKLKSEVTESITWSEFESILKVKKP